MLGCSVASHSHGFLQQDTRVHVNVRDDLRPVESSPRSHGGGLHQRLLPKQLLEVSHVLLAVLTWVEGGASPESLVSLLERPKHRVEQHLVSGLLRRVQELPRRRVVVATCAGRNTSGRVCVKHIRVCEGGNASGSTHRRCG